MLGSILMGSGVLVVILLIGLSLGPPDFLLPTLVILLGTGAVLGVAGIMLAPNEML
jgi:hypothetical protein